MLTVLPFYAPFIMKAILLKHLASYDSWLGASLIGFGLLLHANVVDPIVAVTWLAWLIGGIKLLRSHKE